MGMEGKVQINVSWNCLKDKLTSLNLTVTTLSTIQQILHDLLQVSIVTQEIPNALFVTRIPPTYNYIKGCYFTCETSCKDRSPLLLSSWILICQQSKKRIQFLVLLAMVLTILTLFSSRILTKIAHTETVSSTKFQIFTTIRNIKNVQKQLIWTKNWRKLENCF